MRQEVVERLQVLRMEKLGTSWTDGWVYGRLMEEFELQPDELEFLSEKLGFKYGWNPGLKALLEEQWQRQGSIWKGIQKTVAAQNQVKPPSPSRARPSSPSRARPSSPSRAKPSLNQTRKPSSQVTPQKTKVTTRKRNNSEDELQKSLEQLHSLVGLDAVKSTVQELVNIAKVAKMQAQVGIKAPSITRHLVFTGNPGTGKTTIARLLGNIYKNLGVLSKGHFTEVDRSTLVAEYVGQTAPKTSQAVQDALGGILFIDEAYALVPDGRPDTFGQEAVNTLLKMMEDHRDDLVVIVAGYKDEMSRFIGSNPGLKSRFARSVHFADYAPSELTEIFKMQYEQNGYLCPDESLESLHRLVCEFEGRVGELGNGRFVRNIFDRCIALQCGRLAALAQPTKEDLRTFLPTDIPTSEQLSQSLL
ncbi:MAG: AAA family ATPase [Cyanobacteria bacterium P01_F01_bin.150]